MFYNFFKSFLRSLARNRDTFIINLLGFTLGISVSILIFLFVFNELSFDKYHEKSDRIYRLAVEAMVGDTRINQASSSARVLKEMRERYPEIQNAVKLIDIGAGTFKNGNTVFNEDNIIFTDSTFFEVFSIKISEGEFNRPLSRPNTILLSESSARKYFGDKNPVGMNLEMNNQYFGSNLFEVVAVYEDMPANSHFHFDQLIPNFTFSDLIDDSGWSRNIFVTYLLLEQGVNPDNLEAKFEDYVRESIGVSPEQYDKWVADGNYWKFRLQPLEDIHLQSDLNGEWETNGNIKYVWIFAAIGIFVLLIACINFINLSTAKSTLRSREVGVRKVTGSTRSMLIAYFLGESIVLTFLSLIISIALVQFVLPYYSEWLNRDLSFSLADNWYIVPGCVLGGLIISFINGLYPAFVLSSYEPVKVLKGESSGKNKGLTIRNVLVIIQFAASIFLIMGTLVVNKELNLLQGDDLGFSKKNVMVINTPPEIYPYLGTFTNELKDITGIDAVATSNTLPGFGFSNWGYGAEGIQNSFTLNVIAGDYDFINTMKLGMVEGRYFSIDHPSDSSAAILNETAVRVLGIENPVGMVINNFNPAGHQYFEVIGVVKDFHYESLHSEIRPMAIKLQGGIYNSNVSYITLKYQAGNESNILAAAETLWDEILPGVPMIHSYLEEDFNQLYYNEEQTRQVFSIMAILSVIVACMGLFGLASFISQQRAREVAIRKVFGSSIAGVIRLLLTSYSVWITLAFVIAGPVSFWVMSRWLQNFAFRISIGPAIFIISLLIALILAFITIGSNTNRTARTNPASTLRHQ